MFGKPAVYTLVACGLLMLYNNRKQGYNVNGIEWLYKAYHCHYNAQQAVPIRE